MTETEWTTLGWVSYKFAKYTIHGIISLLLWVLFSGVLGWGGMLTATMMAGVIVGIPLAVLYILIAPDVTSALFPEAIVRSVFIPLYKVAWSFPMFVIVGTIVVAVAEMYLIPVVVVLAVAVTISVGSLITVTTTVEREDTSETNAGFY